MLKNEKIMSGGTAPQTTPRPEDHERGDYTIMDFLQERREICADGHGKTNPYQILPHRSGEQNWFLAHIADSPPPGGDVDGLQIEQAPVERHRADRLGRQIERHCATAGNDFAGAGRPRRRAGAHLEFVEKMDLRPLTFLKDFVLYFYLLHRHCSRTCT